MINKYTNLLSKKLIAFAIQFTGLIPEKYKSFLILKRKYYIGIYLKN
jgi:hypothetical protein